MPYTGQHLIGSTIGKREMELLKEGLSYKQVSAITGTKLGTLKERNRLAYRIDIYAAFQERMQREGIPNRLSVSDAFGHYFTGFFDGEGTIVLWYRRRYRTHYGDGKTYPEYRLGLQIQLRQDDACVLEYIREHLGGYLVEDAHEGSPTNPTTCWKLESIPELAEKIVPLFDQYPLRTKKKAEYKLWRPLVIARYIATLGGETARGGSVSSVFESEFVRSANAVKAIRKFPDSS